MYIQTENLTYTYMPKTPFAAEALRGVTTAIHKGSFTALIGPSGSGKSTFVQHLNGLLKPTGGKVIVDGRSVGDNKKELFALRRKVGLVFQLPEEQFFAETVFDEVAFAPRNLKLTVGAVEGRVMQAMEQVGLDYQSFKDCSPFHLSSGQKRLVAIAAVLSMRPEVLILDEPTAGLDFGKSHKLFSLLNTLNKEANLTVLVVTHHLELLAHLVDSYLVFQAGGLVMQGTPEEVFSRGDELVKLGLALPPVTSIMRSLSAKGYPVRENVFSLSDARQEIVSARKEDDQ